MGAVFGDFDRLGFWNIEHLPFAMIGGLFKTQNPLASRAYRRHMVNNRVGVFHLPKTFASIAFLATRLFAARLALVVNPWRFLQSVTRWRLAAVITVQSNSPFKLF
jgi:hypothetical protein